MNKGFIIGRISTDVELKTTTSGIAVTRFNIASDRRMSNGEKQTDFFTCVAWRNNAEFISKYFQKGNMVLLTGSWQTNSFEDKEGKKRTSYEFIVDSANFTGEKKESKPNIGIEPDALKFVEEAMDQLPF